MISDAEGPKVSVTLHHARYRTKPDTKKLGKITRDMQADTPTELTAAEFCEAVGNGATWCGGVYSADGKPGWGAFRGQQLFGLDFDNAETAGCEKRRAADPVTPARLRGKLEELGLYGFCMYQTFSSTVEWPRLRLVVAASEPARDEAEAREIILRLLAAFPEADAQCKNPNRLFFGGKAGTVCQLWRDGGGLNEVDALLALPLEGDSSRQPSPVRNRGRDADEREQISAFDLLGFCRSLTGEPGRSSGGCVHFRKCPVCGHNDCFRVYPETNTWACFGASNATGKDGGSVIDLLMALNGYTTAEAFAELRRMEGLPAKGPRAVRPALPDGAGPSFELTAAGAPKKTLSNAIAAIDGDEAVAGRLRLNARTGDITISLPLPWDGGAGERKIKDTDLTRARQHISALYGFEPTRQDMADAVEACAERLSFDPVRDFLGTVPDWDGKERARHLMGWYLGAEPGDYAEEVCRLLLNAVVMRTFHPGCKFDYVPVLVGAQGIGKSAFCRTLLMPEYFTDSLASLDPKRAGEVIRGMAVVELAELQALSFARLEEVKAFATRQAETFRAPYAKYADTAPRTCVFVGTTNDPSFLRDLTGNRRFLPVRCSPDRVERDLFSESWEADRVQAWAEVMSEFRGTRGALPLLLPEHVRAAAEAAQMEAMEDDPDIGVIGDYIARMQPGARTCAAEICAHLGRDADRPTVKRVHDILANRFADKVRRTDGKQRVGSYGTQRAYERI